MDIGNLRDNKNKKIEEALIPDTPTNKKYKQSLICTAWIAAVTTLYISAFEMERPWLWNVLLALFLIETSIWYNKDKFRSRPS